ncbi:hypothetical protein JTB14_023132 [Gonioctena quinquepunctata]|nr:hypothetical protein JTB14_023132 [Gonioctena quinquepunctata]
MKISQTNLDTRISTHDIALDTSAQRDVDLLIEKRRIVLRGNAQEHAEETAVEVTRCSLGGLKTEKASGMDNIAANALQKSRLSSILNSHGKKTRQLRERRSSVDITLGVFRFTKNTRHRYDDVLSLDYLANSMTVSFADDLALVVIAQNEDGHVINDGINTFFRRITETIILKSKKKGRHYLHSRSGTD